MKLMWVSEWVIGEAKGMIDHRTQLKKLKWVSKWKIWAQKLGAPLKLIW